MRARNRNCLGPHDTESAASRIGTWGHFRGPGAAAEELIAGLETDLAPPGLSSDADRPDDRPLANVGLRCCVEARAKWRSPSWRRGRHAGRAALRAVRQRRGWRQADVVARAGVSSSSSRCASAVISTWPRSACSVGCPPRSTSDSISSYEGEVASSIASSTRATRSCMRQSHATSSRSGLGFEPEVSSRSMASAASSTSSRGTQLRGACS